MTRWIAILCLVAMLAGCAPRAITQATAAARVDAKVTADMLQTRYATPTTMPAETAVAIVHLRNIERLLLPVQAWLAGKKPADIEPGKPVTP